MLFGEYAGGLLRQKYDCSMKRTCFYTKRSTSKGKHLCCACALSSHIFIHIVYVVCFSQHKERCTWSAKSRLHADAWCGTNCSGRKKERESKSVLIMRAIAVCQLVGNMLFVTYIIYAESVPDAKSSRCCRLCGTSGSNALSALHTKTHKHIMCPTMSGKLSNTCTLYIDAVFMFDNYVIIELG